MIKATSPGAFLCLPLMILLWQGSSCHSSNSNMSNNSARRENANANANTSSNNRQNPADVKGVWGGDHISVEVTDGGATIEYDCAHGTITEKIVPDRNGKFTAKGVHVTEHPGPVRLGEDTEGEPANYSGSINDETMTLTVTMSRTNKDVGTFTLTKGKSGRIRKCM